MFRSIQNARGKHLLSTRSLLAPDHYKGRKMVQVTRKMGYKTAWRDKVEDASRKVESTGIAVVDRGSQRRDRQRVLWESLEP